MTYGTREGDSSQAVTSDAEPHQDFQAGITIPSPPGFSPDGIAMSSTEPLSPACSSLGGKSLATLKQEAIKEKGKAGKRSQVRNKSRGRPTQRRRIGRIMKKEYFESMPWTRTFVSGPMDPKWNPNELYCQICKCKVSIRANGLKEILRHFSTERHLRKNQRWRYEHLTVDDPLTERPRDQVRGRDGRVLTNYQLQLELPHFISAELVDIGEKPSFYEEAMARVDNMSASPQNRTRNLTSILSHYLPLSGDIAVLRKLWQHIGTIVNHQALFCDIDWSTTKLSVSSHTFAYQHQVHILIYIIQWLRH